MTPVRSAVFRKFDVARFLVHSLMKHHASDDPSSAGRDYVDVRHARGRAETKEGRSERDWSPSAGATRADTDLDSGVPMTRDAGKPA